MRPANTTPRPERCPLCGYPHGPRRMCPVSERELEARDAPVPDEAMCPRGCGYRHDPAGPCLTVRQAARGESGLDPKQHPWGRRSPGKPKPPPK